MLVIVFPRDKKEKIKEPFSKVSYGDLCFYHQEYCHVDLCEFFDFKAQECEITMKIEQKINQTDKDFELIVLKEQKKRGVE